MPRRETPITEKTPVAEFANQLRQAKRSAAVTYRQIAKLANYSHVHMVRAASGDHLPSWAVAKAFLAGCGITDPARVAKWRSYWKAVDLAAGRGPVRRRPSAPSQLTTLPEFGEYLRVLGNRGGPRTLRQLQKLTGIGKSTMADWFAGRRLPTAGNLYQFAGLLGTPPREMDELGAVRDRIDRDTNGTSELAKTLDAIRRTHKEGPLKLAARRVGDALVEAEKRRIVRVEPRPTPAPDPIQMDVRDNVDASAAGWVEALEEAAGIAGLLAPQGPGRHVAPEGGALDPTQTQASTNKRPRRRRPPVKSLRPENETMEELLWRDQVQYQPRPDRGQDAGLESGETAER